MRLFGFEMEVGNDSNGNGKRKMEERDVDDMKDEQSPGRIEAEAWFFAEIQSLINFRRKLEAQFNNVKSNEDLGNAISAKLRERGFNCSPSLCAEKWGDLLTEYYGMKRQSGEGGVTNVSCDEMVDYFTYKMKDLVQQEPLIPESQPAPTFSETGNEHSVFNLPRAPDQSQHLSNINANYAVVANEVSPGHGAGNEQVIVNLPRGLDQNQQLSNISANYAAIANYEVSVRHWAGNEQAVVNIPRGLDQNQHLSNVNANYAAALNEVSAGHWLGGAHFVNYAGRVITIRWGDCVKRIGIDGSSETITDVIKYTFGLRSTRSFWLEDDYGILRSISRDMPLGSYTLHLDDGLTIKIYLDNATDESPAHTEEITLYSEDDFYDFLRRCGFIALIDLKCYKMVNSINDLHHGEVYQGYRAPTN